MVYSVNKQTVLDIHDHNNSMFGLPVMHVCLQKDRKESLATPGALSSLYSGAASWSDMQ